MTRRRTIGLVGALALALLGAAAFWAFDGGAERADPDGEPRYADPELGSTSRGADLDDAGPAYPTGAPRDPDAPFAQPQDHPGRTDGAVPLVGVTPPYASPDGEDMSPAELRRRRLEQVAEIERRIAEIDELAARPNAPRGLLLSRREHLELRRAQLLGTVVEEAR